MKAVYASTGADLSAIANMGFDTIIGNLTVAELDWLQDNQMKCIYSGMLVHPAISAYYVYDEPDMQKIPIADQEATIAKYREFTTKPLAIACIEQTKRMLSTNYDIYMLDIYYMTQLGSLGKTINYLNIAHSTFILKELYKGKNIIPIMGLYDDLDRFRFSKETFEFAKKFRSYFRETNDQAIFIWKGDAKTYWGIADRDVYKSMAVYLNQAPVEKISRAVEWKLKLVAKAVVAVRSRITDEMLVKLNTILPKAWKLDL